MVRNFCTHAIDLVLEVSTYDLHHLQSKQCLLSPRFYLPRLGDYFTLRRFSRSPQVVMEAIMAPGNGWIANILIFLFPFAQRPTLFWYR